MKSYSPRLKLTCLIHYNLHAKSDLNISTNSLEASIEKCFAQNVKLSHISKISIVWLWRVVLLIKSCINLALAVCIEFFCNVKSFCMNTLNGFNVFRCALVCVSTFKRHLCFILLIKLKEQSKCCVYFVQNSWCAL